jgi:2-oxoisovalerate dehydrogenase E1 component alpha subunit
MAVRRSGTPATPAQAAQPSGALRATWREVRHDGSLGVPRQRDVELSFDRLRDLYRLMMVGRRLEQQATTLARQGVLGVYASSRGQEACEVGAVAALEEQDWLFPTYRDSLAAYARGVAMAEILALFVGSGQCGFDPRAHRVAPLCTPLATHLPHAVGLAMAASLRRDPVVALALLGDGASSEGDSHEAMNFAGVSGAPCVFLVQNNQYAISVPLRRQTAAVSIALRAAGCGIAGSVVDGNDVVSVYACVRDAVERARRGAGPTLIEALTYRLEPHTTTDDPNRYRSDEEVARWRERDPIERLRQLLLEHGEADADFEKAVEAEGEVAAAEVRERLRGAAPPDPLEMFDHVRSELAPELRRQRAEVAAIIEAETERD